MKRIIYIFTVLIIGSTLFVFNSCMKDKMSPNIFPIGGDQKDSCALTFELQQFFVDSGAKADDNFDGAEITKKITATHNIPLKDGYTTTAGMNYHITYKVTDNKGNETTFSRPVYVINRMRKYAIDYLVDKVNIPLHSKISIFPEYNNMLDTLGVDARNNNRMIFPKVSKGITNPSSAILPGFLRIVADVNTSDNKTITIPVQTFIKKDLLTPFEEWAYQIVGDPGSSKINIDTANADNFQIVLTYTIYKLKKLGTTDPTTWRYYQDTISGSWYGGISNGSPTWYDFAKCQETYRRQ